MLISSFHSLLWGRLSSQLQLVDKKLTVFVTLKTCLVKKASATFLIHTKLCHDITSGFDTEMNCNKDCVALGFLLFKNLSIRDQTNEET